MLPPSLETLSALMHENRWQAAVAVCRQLELVSKLLRPHATEELSSIVTELAGAITNAQDRATLYALANVLQQEAHWLAEDPAALPSLLFNRLLSQGHPAEWIHAHFIFPPGEPILALRHPVRMGNAVRTIQTQSIALNGCMIVGTTNDVVATICCSRLMGNA